MKFLGVGLALMRCAKATKSRLDEELHIYRFTNSHAMLEFDYTFTKVGE